MTIAVAPAGLRKAAILLVILGEDAASEIYRHLPPSQVEHVTQEIAGLSSVDAETALAVLEEFERLVMTGDYLVQGGKDYANKLLIKAFGEEGAKELLRQVSLTAEMSASKLDSLQKTDPQQLAQFIEGEHPQTVALILAHLDAKQASALLMRLPEELRAEAIKRLAQLRQFSPEMAERVALVLHKRLQALGEQGRRAYAGLRGVADVMNRLELTTAKTILEGIEKEDPKLALSIRNLMFTFEDLLTVPEAGIRELLGQMDKKTLATALRGGRRGIKELHFQVDVLARRRDAERRHGSAGPGEIAGGSQSPAGSCRRGAEAGSRGQDFADPGGRR